MAAVTICSDFGAQENKVWHCFPNYLPWSDAPKQMPWSLFFECRVLSQSFHSPLSLSSRGSLVFHFLPRGWCYLHIWGYWYFSWQSWFQLVLHLDWHFSWCTAGSRSSAPGKGHEEGGSAYAKVGSSLRSPPGNSRASTPQNQSLPTFCFVLSPTPLALRGAVPHYLSLKKELTYSSS